MMIVHSYGIAVALCFLTMLCWGSHANTMKLVPRSYPYSLYYWDQAIGYLLLPLFVGLTFGSFGLSGRSLIEDLSQGSASTFGWAMAGGVVFNLSNIIFMAAISVAGMAVAFPVGIGVALVEGVVINYIADPKGNPWLIFVGVAMITSAIILDASAYRGHQGKVSHPGELIKGATLAMAGGILMGLFYYFVQRSISPDFSHLEPGKFGPYAAAITFSSGSFMSNLVLTSYVMSHPFSGPKATYSDYFGVRPIKGLAHSSAMFKYHLIGILGGLINCTGTTVNFVASKRASPAIAYGLGQSGAMVAAIWGVFVWKEFNRADRKTVVMIVAMFTLFIGGLALLIISML